MKIAAIFQNSIFWAGMTAWILAQVLKPPIGYLRTRQWDWALLLRAGGMPSSHSALVAATAHAIGLFEGFDSPFFALAVTLAIIVIYDATGIRRQAGIHAGLINRIVNELSSGHLPGHETQEQLKEVLGHTPIEALAGTLLGIVIAQAFWYFVGY
ncbi:MAG: divergent PAP2 family protein [Chloroflexi bacterium]|nr:divergent PAP2 family protein [Chloroflexota bacterium]